VEVVFGGEIAEEQAAGYAGDLGDPVDGQRVDGTCRQFLEADGDELPASLLRPETATPGRLLSRGAHVDSLTERCSVKLDGRHPMDFAQSERSRDYLERLRAFIATEVAPVEQQIRAARRVPGEQRRDVNAAEAWSISPEFRELQRKAREAGLWNLFLPDADLGAGLSNVEYAPLAEEMGRTPFASAVFNCDAPDTGNMEVLYHYGSEAQKEQWLRPLLDGEIRSAFCMTEPDVASSDATNMAATAVVDGDEIVLNGRKWWSTGVGHPDCKVLIFMGLTDPEAHKYQRHSMVLVPFDTPGVEVERMLPTMGFFDEPSGHGEVSFTDVRLPLDAVIAGPGRGFEIAQGRLGPGR